MYTTERWGASHFVWIWIFHHLLKSVLFNHDTASLNPPINHLNPVKSCRSDTERW